MEKMSQGDKFTFETTAGVSFSYTLPDPCDTVSMFMFGMHKSASTLMHTMMRDVFAHLDISVVDIDTALFNQGLLPVHITDSMSSLFHGRGYAYLGFRNFWLQESYIDLALTKNILLIRDPRDAIVSHYFSTKYSHTIPDKGPVGDTMSKVRSNLEFVPVDEYAMQDNIVGHFLNGYKNYQRNLPAISTRVYRYEDVIFYKREWLEDMLVFLDIQLDKNTVHEIVKRYDIRPDKERPDQHVRQVSPGNYLTHLQPDTVDFLNSVFADVLHRYGYDSVRHVEL